MRVHSFNLVLMFVAEKFNTLIIKYSIYLDDEDTSQLAVNINGLIS